MEKKKKGGKQDVEVHMANTTLVGTILNSKGGFVNNQ
jgi:hypothetical protein